MEQRGKDGGPLTSNSDKNEEEKKEEKRDVVSVLPSQAPAATQARVVVYIR